MSLGSLSSRLLKVLCLYIMIVHISFAQGSGTIRGKVYDRTTKEELPGANVIVKGTSLGAASDLDGGYILRNVPSGRHTLVVTYVGYTPETVELDIPAGEIVNMILILILPQ